MKLRMTIITLTAILVLAGKSLAFTEPEMIGEGGFPTIAQDENGIYWLLFDNESGLYLMNSSNLLN